MIIGLRHKLYIEWIRKIALRNGVHLDQLVDPLGNATDCMMLHLELDQDHGLDVTLVIPHPPDDWVLR